MNNFDRKLISVGFIMVLILLLLCNHKIENLKAKLNDRPYPKITIVTSTVTINEVSPAHMLYKEEFNLKSQNRTNLVTW